ncbi:alanine racemase [Ningiella sp. W23]|uniref:alanine racemase n=1 Tax=Ningiella sp. W23 TaxID=3023715 RepID=UPI003756C781
MQLPHTPALILDVAKTAKNIQTASSRAKALGVQLRPHLKTCKSVPVARLALGANWDGVAVSTINEAKLFFEAGIKNIRYTPPFAADKLGLVAPLIRNGLHFGVLLDHIKSLKLLSEQSESLQVPVKVCIEIDCDQNRGGVIPLSEEFWAIFDDIQQSDYLEFDGIYSYAGKTYSLADKNARMALIEHHRLVLLKTKNAIESKGVYRFNVGMGSSPALHDAASLAGLTEICCGVNMFQDLAQVGVNAADVDDISVSVLASVVQHKQDNGRIYIDAGGLALSQDRSTAEQEKDYGYGLVCNEKGEPLLDATVIVQSVSQEHGLVMRIDGSPMPPDILAVGSKVRVLPNHVCMTVSHYDEYHLLNQQGITNDKTWQRTNGWQ